MQQLHDKFNVIENHITNEESSDMISKIDNYFENYINSDYNILIQDYLNQYMHFNPINNNLFICNIESHIKSYLFQTRNNMRLSIKKDTLTLNSLNKFIKKIITKCEYLTNILKSSNVITNAIKQLNSLVISDSMILMFIEDQCISLNKDIFGDIQIFYESISYLGKYDNFEIQNYLLKTIGNGFRKEIINFPVSPLSENHIIINNLQLTISYYYKIKTYYYKFTNMLIFNKLYYPIYTLMIDYLIVIIKKNTISTVEFVLSNIYKTLPFIIDYNLIKTIIDEIIILFTKNIKSKTVDDDLDLLKIIYYIDSIKPKIKDYSSDKFYKFLNTIPISCDVIDKIDNNSIIILMNMKNSDELIHKYYYCLIQRLLNYTKLTDKKEFNNYIVKETDIIKKLGGKHEIIIKMTKAIIDIMDSFSNMQSYNQSNINIITISYNNWDINQTEGVITGNLLENISNTLLYKEITAYNQFYKNNNKNKILNWFLHFGEINITYLEKNIKLLPIQFLVLEMIENKYDIKNAKIFSNYSPKFINDIISSLIIGKILLIENNNIILNDTPNFDDDFINIFFTTLDYSSIWEEKRKELFVHSRFQIINTNINKILKTSTLNENNLFAHVKKSISLFDVEKEQFDKSLKYMIDSDYIKINSQDEYEKLLF